MGVGATVLVWIVLGSVVGLMSLALPYHKGYAGVAARIAISIAGAVLFALLGRVVRFYGQLDHPRSFMIALLGALVAAIGYWVLWSWETYHRRGRAIP